MSSRKFNVIEGGIANTNRQKRLESNMQYVMQGGYLDCDLMRSLPGGRMRELGQMLSGGIALTEPTKSQRRERILDGLAKMAVQLADDWGDRQMIRDMSNAMRKARNRSR